MVGGAFEKSPPTTAWLSNCEGFENGSEHRCRSEIILGKANKFVPRMAEPSPRTARRQQSLSWVGSAAEHTLCLGFVRFVKLLSSGAAHVTRAVYTTCARSVRPYRSAAKAVLCPASNGQSRARQQSPLGVRCRTGINYNIPRICTELLRRSTRDVFLFFLICRSISDILIIPSQ